MICAEQAALGRQDEDHARICKFGIGAGGRNGQPAGAVDERTLVAARNNDFNRGPCSTDRTLRDNTHTSLMDKLVSARNASAAVAGGRAHRGGRLCVEAAAASRATQAGRSELVRTR